MRPYQDETLGYVDYVLTQNKKISARPSTISTSKKTAKIQCLILTNAIKNEPLKFLFFDAQKV